MQVASSCLQQCMLTFAECHYMRQEVVGVRLEACYPPDFFIHFPVCHKLLKTERSISSDDISQCGWAVGVAVGVVCSPLSAVSIPVLGSLPGGGTSPQHLGDKRLSPSFSEGLWLHRRGKVERDGERERGEREGGKTGEYVKT